jgi:hypothetical protein
MAKTFKLNVSFPMTLKVSTDTVNEFLEARKDAREILASGKVLKGESKFRVELLASDKEDDEVLQTIFRTGIREVIRKDLIKEICGNESTGSVGDTLVVFETFQKPEVCTCDGVTTGCSRCPGKRWTETV